MKQVFNTLGENTTSATQTYLMSTDTRSLYVKDCYFIGPPMQYPYAGIGSSNAVNFGAYPVVDGDYPIEYQGVTYQPFAVEKSKLEYKLGFEVSKLQLTLTPRGEERAQDLGISPYLRGDGSSFSEGGNSTPPYYDPYGNLSSTQAFQDMRQGFATSDWYLAPVTMTRMFMAMPGDTTTYGGAVMFRGRVSDITVDRHQIIVTVSSLMEIFSQKVPSQIIEPGSRFVAWDFSSTPNYSGTGTGTGSYAWFEASFTGGTPADNTLLEGWGVFTVNGYGSWERRIFTNTGAVIYLFEPLPVNLGSGVTVVFQAWVAGNTQSVEGEPGQGFPSVPKPEIGVL
jgi:hypothetical protein